MQDGPFFYVGYDPERGEAGDAFFEARWEAGQLVIDDVIMGRREVQAMLDYLRPARPRDDRST